MGVPKFYRWLSERYPKINQVVTDSALLPEFDHLYLDMNGIIHGCTHPNHMDISDVLTEREMMMGIMNYLDRIITQIVKPKVSVYMAIDGVAPRAKLNQQRSRRFRSAKDLEEATKDMPKQQQQQGGKRDNSDNDGSRNSAGVFDSNCITPGTQFMVKVSETVKYFIRKKIKEDPLWRNLSVIFSGPEVPGEGEHKIMQHIRDMRNQPGYQPNTRHCMYGQDADLIMLALVSHEPHFTLLREVVDFGFDNGNNKNALKAVMKFTKQSDFQLLHISILREYLQMEFCLEQPQYDLEAVIDDFVFMTYLVGNDFLPHMPTLDIGDGAFDLLFALYKEQREQWGANQYLTRAGEISSASRLEAFLAAIGAVETEILVQKEKDEAVYVKKRRRWDRRDGKGQGPSDSQLAAAEAEKQGDYLSMIQSLMAKHNLNDTAESEGEEDEDSSSPFVAGWTPVRAGEKDFKGRYYFEKLRLTPANVDEHWNMRKSYIEGLMWCLAYYYRGCISWGWFYPYHYGPMLSDLINIPKMFDEIKFEMGKPLTPFEQLMACLPPASSNLVPRLYRSLMTAPDSPIIHFYPKDFVVDMNGKRNPWEGVNLLPFIDVRLLKETIAVHCPDSVLSVEERKRNSLGKVFCYTFDLASTETIPSPNRTIGLPDILACNSKVSIFDEPDRTGVSFKPELVPGTKIPFPGFPSLNVLPIASVEMIKAGLNVFGSPSKYATMVLTLHSMPELPPLESLANNVLGKPLFVNWPMMHEGRVVAISDENVEIRLHQQKTKVRKFSKMESERWMAESETLVQQYFVGSGVPGSGGVQIGEIRVRLKLLPLQGMKTVASTGATKKFYGQEEADVPVQLALWSAPAPDPRFIERGPPTIDDRFPINSTVVLTKGKYRGCTGTVVGVADKKVGVKVQISPPELPFGLAIAQSVHETYIPSFDAAKILKLQPGIFGKITGSMLFEPGRYDLGLNLKYAEGLCVLGYVRKKKEGKNGNQGQRGNNPNDGKEKPKAWEAGDSLLVVGSSRKQSFNDADEEREEKIVWEYTPKAIRLVNEYRQKFPQLFNGLMRQPNERKYEAKKIFGPNGEEWLSLIREWLNNIETAKLPRSPVTTEAMPAEAVAAVERAADVRTVALKKRGPPAESLVKVPPSALYREGSTSPTDVLLATDFNDNEAPQLGDRIVNLCASGLPFGAKGTVIGVHEARTGCVEVLMDEEFIGGSSLQGVCSNFRGKLCVWAHLLKVSPANSQDVVDKLVPKGSGRAAVNKIIADIERQARTQKAQGSSKDPPKVAEAVDRQNRSMLAEVPVVDSRSPPEPASTPRNTSAPKSVQAGKPVVTSRPSSRAGSSGRGRQPGWREAIGPDQEGVGFKGKRQGKSGLNRWKGHVAPNPTASIPNAVKESNPDARLKALLGVTSATPEQRKEPTLDADAAAGLKALLGVRSSADPPQSVFDIPEPPTPPPVPASFLRDISVPPPNDVSAQQAFPQPPPSAPASAADRFLQLMASRQQQQQQQRQHHAPVPMMPPISHPSFSFTYVEEGKEQSQHPMPFPPPPPAMSIPAQWGVMYPVPMGMPHGPPPMMMHMAPPAHYVQGFPPAPPPMSHFIPPPREARRPDHPPNGS